MWHAFRALAHTLLRRSERYTKTDMLYLAKGSFWLVASQGTAVLAGVGIAVALANLVSPEVFGTYKFVLSLAGVIGAFSLTGMALAVTQSVAKGSEGALRQGFKTSLMWSTGVMFIAFAGAFYYYLNDNTVLAASLLIVGVFSPLTHSASLFGSYLTGKKEFRVQALYNICRTLVFAGVFIGTLFLTDNPLLIVAVYFLGNAAITLYCYHRTLRACAPQEGTDPDLTRFSTHLSVMNILILIGNHLDKVLVFHVLGATPLALYAFAVAPVDSLRSVNKVIQTLVLPKFSERSFSDLQKSIPRKAALLLLCVIPITAAYIMAAPYLYRLLFPQYVDAVALSQLYALVLLATPFILFYHMLLAHKKKKELYATHVFMPLSKIALFLILLPLYGLMGLIIALIVAKVLELLFVMAMSLHSQTE